MRVTWAKNFLIFLHSLWYWIWLLFFNIYRDLLRTNGGHSLEPWSWPIAHTRPSIHGCAPRLGEKIQNIYWIQFIIDHCNIAQWAKTPRSIKLGIDIGRVMSVKHYQFWHPLRQSGQAMPYIVLYVLYLHTITNTCTACFSVTPLGIPTKFGSTKAFVRPDALLSQPWEGWRTNFEFSYVVIFLFFKK